MLKRGMASFWLGVMSGLVAAATAWAKPADLPSVNPIECHDSQEKSAPIAEPESAPALDGTLPAFLECWLQHAADVLRRPDRVLTVENLWRQLPAATATVSEPAAPKVAGVETKADKQIRHLFDVADHYRRTGLYDAARFCFQRVHLLSPTSRLGQLAIERLQEIEDRLRESEQSEPSRKDEGGPQSRDIRNGTMPLGLVVVTY